MKKLMLSALAATLALSACGDAGHAASAREPELTTTLTPDEVPVGKSFELRLRGTNAQEYRSVLVPVRALQVTTLSGEPLSVRLAARTVELTDAEHAYLVGNFFVPQGVTSVRVQLAFDDYGGWEKGGEGGALNTQVAPVSFEAPVDSLSQRGRAVVQLDVGKSLQVDGAQDERVLLPTLKVSY